jgi:hypothetical protein
MGQVSGRAAIKTLVQEFQVLAQVQQAQVFMVRANNGVLMG